MVTMVPDTILGTMVTGAAATTEGMAVTTAATAGVQVPVMVAVIEEPVCIAMSVTALLANVVPVRILNMVVVAAVAAIPITRFDRLSEKQESRNIPRLRGS